MTANKMTVIKSSIFFFEQNFVFAPLRIHPSDVKIDFFLPHIIFVLVLKIL